MAQTKTMEVPVIPGMRQDLSSRVAPPGTLSYAKNVRFPIQGEVEARPGTTALDSSSEALMPYSTIMTGNGPDYLARVPGGFLFGWGGFGFRYDFGKSHAHVAGSYANALPYKRLTSIAREELLQADSNLSTPWPLSQACTGGYIGVLYSIAEGGGVDPEDNGLFFQVFTEGGTVVGSLTRVAVGNALGGFVVVDSSAANRFVVVYQDGTDLQATVITLAASGISVGSYTSVGTLGNTSTRWAACNWPGIGWALAYQSSALGTMTVKKMAGTATTTSTTFAVTGTTCPASCYANSTYLYVGWRDGTVTSDSSARVYDTSLTLTSGGTISMMTDGTAGVLTPPLFGSHVAGDGTAFCVVAFSQGPEDFGTFMRAFTLTSAGAKISGDSSRDAYGLLPVTMPFNNGMVWCRRSVGTSIPSVRNVLVDYQMDRAGVSYFSSNYLVDPKTALVTEEFVNDPTTGSAWRGGWYRQHLGTPVQTSTLYWVAGLPRIVRLEPTATTSGGLAIAEWCMFKTEQARVPCGLGSDVIIPGDPVLSQHPWGTKFSGSDTQQQMGSDLGFYSAPQISSISPSTATGMLFGGTTYQYRAVVERIDSAAQRYRSAPSAVASVTTAAANNQTAVTVRYPSNLLRSYSQGNITPSRNVIHLYRTASVASGVMGEAFQRTTPPQGVPFTANASVVINDFLSDASLARRELLYTDGGVFANDHPPSCRFVRATEDRVWLGGLWDTNQLQSSKILVPGEPPQFSDDPAYRVVLPDACTGVAVQDGIVFAFCRSAIYAIQGSGPSDQGQGAWDSPRCITSSTGAINEFGIVETSIGIFFESSRGIELMPRGGGEPQFIGEGVMDLPGQLGSGGVVSACVVTTTNTKTVRFCLGSVYVLVFDLDTRAWSFDEYPAAVTAICDTDNGAVLALQDRSTGPGGDSLMFYLEQANDTVDDAGSLNADIASDIVWVDLRPFGVAGYGKFSGVVGLFDRAPNYLSGTCKLLLTVDTQTDAGASFNMSTFASPAYKRHVPQYDVGTAAQLRLTTTVAGWKFAGATLELETIGGARRVGETEQG